MIRGVMLAGVMALALGVATALASPPVATDTPDLGLGSKTEATPPPVLVAPPVLDGPALVQDREAKVVRRATNADFDAVFPKAALRKGIEGEAMVRCVTGEDTRLRDCTVLSESPEGYGFGEAAVALMGRIRVAPEIYRGRPREQWMRFPVIFRIPPPPPVRIAPPPDIAPPPTVTRRTPAFAPSPADVLPPAPSRAEVRRPPAPPIDWSWLPPQALASLCGVLAFLLALFIGVRRFERRAAQ